eukprot:IDg17403t1
MTGSVSASMCSFCPMLGREPKLGQKRKQTKNLQVFKLHFRTDFYKRHHLSSHPDKWTEFEQATREYKNTFFSSIANYGSTLLITSRPRASITDIQPRHQRGHHRRSAARP